jgi:iron complex transport system permease protein
VSTAAASALATLRAGRRSRRRRETVVASALAAALLGVAALSMTMGAFAISPADVVRVLLGGGEGIERFVVMDLRLPRLTMGVLVGAAFGVAGAVFQTVLGNPLASPDILGINWGASLAAVAGLLLLGMSGPAVSLMAFGGALAVAAAIYALAWRGGVTGHRFVLIGVAVAFMASAILNYMLTRSDVRDAQTALVWMVGSLGSAAWEEIAVAAVALAVLLPLAACLAGALRALQLGDDAATGLGVPAERARLGLILTGVALAAVGTAAAGPVAFVALVSAPIARRLAGTGGLALLPAAMVGALVVTLADLIALHLLPGDVQAPVGVVTGAVGAPYLMWLLAVSDRGEGR